MRQHRGVRAHPAGRPLGAWTLDDGPSRPPLEKELKPSSSPSQAIQLSLPTLSSGTTCILHSADSVPLSPNFCFLKYPDFTAFAVTKYQDKKRLKREGAGRRGLFQLTIPGYSPSFQGNQGIRQVSHVISTDKSREIKACMVELNLLSPLSYSPVQDPKPRGWCHPW